MKYILPLLLLAGCASNSKVLYLRLKGINWRCEYNTERMNCHNMAKESRYVRKKEK